MVLTGEKGHFPKPVKLGARAAAWRRRDIEKLAAKLTKTWDKDEKWVDDETFDPVKEQP
ncbi:AlpA family phage regulatory protein [Alcaligenes faecalis]|uniref:AlpA family phage regulatory protein n=1 Tax=Alcaligenes faecalis TaxID=511 RepID=A0AAE9KN83_ALCFA|nr:AlpA family phage regulatory protein [Alcaligenes faecalis]UPL21019.1 AlpA family phage regulatory protein [Alcaligenes faecalis]